MVSVIVIKRWGLLTAGRCRDSSTSQDNNPLALTTLDVIGDRRQGPCRQGMRRDGVVHEGQRFFLTHFATRRARDSGSLLVAITTSSTYGGGAVASKKESTKQDRKTVFACDPGPVVGEDIGFPRSLVNEVG